MLCEQCTNERLLRFNMLTDSRILRGVVLSINRLRLNQYTNRQLYINC